MWVSYDVTPTKLITINRRVSAQKIIWKNKVTNNIMQTGNPPDSEEDWGKMRFEFNSDILGKLKFSQILISG